MILLAQHLPIYAEDAHIAALQGVVVHLHHAAVGDIGLHGVALNPHRQLRPHGHFIRNGKQLIVLHEHRGGKARRRRRGVQLI